MPQPHPWSATHPFLDFTLRVEQIPQHVSVMLGECSSKIEHVMGTPLRQDIADRLSQVFLAKGVHGTTAIEGNSLTEEQVRHRLAGGRPLPPTQEYLGQEVDNIVTGYNHLVAQLNAGVPHRLTPDDLSTLNRIVLEGLEIEEGVTPGEFRQGFVVVGDYRSPSAEHVRDLLERGCDWLNSGTWEQVYGGQFVLPILRAIMSHLYIAWVHPFGDGNGRTARLVEFDLLIRAGVPIASAHLLSDYYNRTRMRYYRALSDARQSPIAFISYAVEGLREMLREQIAMIREFQYEVTWANYVYTSFRPGEDSRAARRQRAVLLALGEQAEPVPISAIATLTPTLAIMYGQVQPRTLTLDLGALHDAGLITVEQGAVRANLKLIRAFLPATGVSIA